jgi:hypothetical protein
MPIEIKIIDESTGGAMLTLAHLAKAVSAPDARTMSLDDLMTITRERFAQAGIVITLSAKDPIAGAAVAAAVEAAEKVLADPLGDAEAEEAEEIVPVKRTKKKKAEAQPAAQAQEDPAADADRAYVLDELTKRFADPKQKTKTKAFIDGISSQHGGVRLSRLDQHLFPAIRKEMETTFGHGGNGHGA